MSGFGIFLLMFTVLLLAVGLIQALAAWDRFLEQGGFRSALDRLAYVNREPVRAPLMLPKMAVPEVVPVVVPPDPNAGSGDSEPGTGTELVPDVSHRMSDITIIALLAMQKDDDAEYRFSANEIAELIGKRRAGTLEHVRSLRPAKKKELPHPQFAPLTPEQQASRQALALEQ